MKIPIEAGGKTQHTESERRIAQHITYTWHEQNTEQPTNSVNTCYAHIEREKKNENEQSL